MLVGVVALGLALASCSSSPSKPSVSAKAPKGALAAKVPQPSNCQYGTASNPTPHVFVGLKATAKTGVTTKQVAGAIAIPNEKTLPCASGLDYVPGSSPLAVQVFFLKGATAANQNTVKAAFTSSGLFTAVTVVAPS